MGTNNPVFYGNHLYKAVDFVIRLRFSERCNRKARNPVILALKHFFGLPDPRNFGISVNH